MFMKSKILFFFMLIMGTMISVTSNSWLGIWMGLEINLLSFIPMINNNNLMASEASLKYFLIQSFASSIFMFSFIIMFMNFYLYYKIIYIKILILFSLFMKCGIVPFHFWFPNIVEGLNWMNLIILMTWQKFAPFTIISYIEMIYYLMMTVSSLSLIIGAMGGLNQISLRKLMAYSSINHMGWMMGALLINDYLWILYLMIYSIMVIILFFMFNLEKLYYVNQMYNYYNKNLILNFYLFLNLLSMGGLPPFFGFISKWFIIKYLCMEMQYFYLLIMIFSTLITLYYYLKLTYSVFLLNYFENNWIFNNYSIFNNYMYLISIISIYGLISISMFYILF